MSFTELKVAELKKVAETFAVDAEGLKTKTDLIARLNEEGISWQMYNNFKTSEKEEIKIPPAEKLKREAKIMSKVSDQILVKMDRSNLSYEILGFSFTRDHPFQAMSAEAAQKIFDSEDGFRIATPREAQEYYA